MIGDKIVVPCDWKTVDLLETEDPNEFGEALRNYCFVGNCEQTGCYSTFDLIPQLKEVKFGKIYEEARKMLLSEDDDEEIRVFYWEVKGKDCYIEKYKICEPFELVCAWFWDGDGFLYFRYKNRAVINTDCKKDYYWEWLK
jgi:hypothetical protein